MTKSTVASIPTDLQDSDLLRKFLTSLVIRVDLLEGFRGNNRATSLEDLEALRNELVALQRQLEESLATINQVVDTANILFNSPFGVLTNIDGATVDPNDSVNN